MRYVLLACFAGLLLACTITEHTSGHQPPQHPASNEWTLEELSAKAKATPKRCDAIAEEQGECVQEKEAEPPSDADEEEAPTSEKTPYKFDKKKQWDDVKAAASAGASATALQPCQFNDKDCD